MSKTFNISLLPGDGTGPEVVDEAVKVLSKTSSYYDTQFNFYQNDLGGDRYCLLYTSQSPRDYA